MPVELKAVVRVFGLQRQASGAYTGTIGGTEVVATTTGIGTRRARKATEAALAAGDIDHVIVAGIAGAVGTTHGVGDVVIPAVVVDGASGTRYTPAPLEGVAAAGAIWTSDILVTNSVRLAELGHDGITAVDMETAAVAAVCTSQQVPWSAFRGISDRAGDGSVDDEVLAMTGPDGRPRARAVARFLVRHPAAIPRLARLARDTNRATTAAAVAARHAVRDHLQ